MNPLSLGVREITFPPQVPPPLNRPAGPGCSLPRARHAAFCPWMRLPVQTVGPSWLVAVWPQPPSSPARGSPRGAPSLHPRHVSWSQACSGRRSGCVPARAHVNSSWGGTERAPPQRGSARGGAPPRCIPKQCLLVAGLQWAVIWWGASQGEFEFPRGGAPAALNKPLKNHLFNALWPGNNWRHPPK